MIEFIGILKSAPTALHKSHTEMNSLAECIEWLISALKHFNSVIP